MQEPPVPDNEAQRLQALRLLEILDTPAEERFDRITRIAQNLFGVPIALVSLVDANRQWFKSCQGLDASETPRGISFCGHAILSDEIFCIEDATRDPRFADNPLVLGPPDIRFYVGAPLIVEPDIRVGTLCLIDRKPRRFDTHHQRDLRDLADWVQEEFNRVKLGEATTIIRAQEASLRALLGNITDSILTIDTQARIQSANAAVSRMFGMQPQQLIDEPLTRLLPDFTVERYLEPLHIQDAEGAYGNKVNCTTVARNVEGREVPVDVTVTGMLLPEGRAYIVSVRDISEAQRLELMKREFVSIVSHELRTPLTAIRGALGLVTGGVAGAVPDKVAEMLKIADKNSMRLINLVNDILLLEKIELGRLSFEITEVEIQPLLQKTIELNNDYATSFGVGLELSSSLPDSTRICADSDRLLQALTNLISNAVKYSPSGDRVRLHAELAAKDQKLKMTVQDAGPGIPVDLRESIFERFQQIDMPGRRAKGGTGLGLSIAKAIIEAFGGKIGVECPAAGGSCFYIELPLHSTGGCA